MGNQVSALALGGDTYKLKFGHRGANQTGAVQGRPDLYHHPESWFCGGCRVTPGRVRVTYTNVNDGTVEGFENDDLCLTTVQFHPEAHRGPRDTEQHFFDALFRRLK